MHNGYKTALIVCLILALVGAGLVAGGVALGGKPNFRLDWKNRTLLGGDAELKTGETAQYWSLIRSRTYFHSTIYSKYRDLSSVDKASYEAVTSGKKASHACIRLLVPDARWIFYNICYDTTCEIRKGSKDDAEMQAIREQMHFAAWKDNADLSVAHTPYTDNWRIEDVQIDMPYVHATQPPVPKS